MMSSINVLVPGLQTLVYMFTQIVFCKSIEKMDNLDKY